MPTGALVTSCDSPVNLDAAKAAISKADGFAKQALDTGEAKNVAEFVDGFDVFKAKNFAGHFCLSIDVVGGVEKVVEVGVEALVVNVSEKAIAIESCRRLKEGRCLEHVCSEVV